MRMPIPGIYKIDVNSVKYDSHLIGSWRDNVCLTLGSFSLLQVCDAFFFTHAHSAR